jgi:predicted kinase
MDLERLGRRDLADRFLADYREFADDVWPASLAHHHVAYRAQVRAKVAAIRASQGVEAAAVEARALLALARRHLEAGAVRLVLVGGLPGTGKSTLATGLGATLGATVLRSDEVRKELAGMPADRPAAAPYGEGLYRPESTAATYGEMLARTGVALGLGEPVVLDASWISERWRADARALASSSSADLVEIRCSVTPSVAARRIRRRMTKRGDPSDATPDIATKLAVAEDPWPGAVGLDTGGSQADALAKALAVVTPSGPPGAPR